MPYRYDNDHLRVLQVSSADMPFHGVILEEDAGSSRNACAGRALAQACMYVQTKMHMVILSRLTSRPTCIGIHHIATLDSAAQRPLMISITIFQSVLLVECSIALNNALLILI